MLLRRALSKRDVVKSMRMDARLLPRQAKALHQQLAAAVMAGEALREALAFV